MNDVYELTRRIDALEKEIDRLKRATANLPIRTSGGGGGGGGFEIVEADTKANLPASNEPAIGYTTSTYRYYVRSNAAWLCVSHLEAS